MDSTVSISDQKPWKVWDGPSAYSTKTLIIGRRRFNYVDEGTGQAVVLIRNTPFACERVYDLQIPALVKEGYRTIAPYRAGTGGSDFRDFVSVTTESEDIYALLDYLGVTTCAVMGRCQGARVARQMLLSRPGVIEAFINYESGTFGRIRWYGDIVYSADSPRPFVRPETRALWEKNKAKLFELKREWDYPADYNIEFAVRQNEFDAQHKELCEKTALRDDPRDLPEPPEKYCKIPVLSISTGWGRVTQGDPMVRERSQAAPAENLKMVIITESGHHPNEEQPELFNRALLDFLASISPRSGK
jgi:3-oxoadipate enol-lactonase